MHQNAFVQKREGSHLRIIGKRSIKTKSNTGGKIPWMIPTTGLGNLQSQESQWYVAQSP
jgi:hypothetical protein